MFFAFNSCFQLLKSTLIKGSLSDWICIFQTYRFQFKNNPSSWFCVPELLAVSLGFGTTQYYWLHLILHLIATFISSRVFDYLAIHFFRFSVYLIMFDFSCHKDLHIAFRPIIFQDRLVLNTSNQSRFSFGPTKAITYCKKSINAFCCIKIDVLFMQPQELSVGLCE